MANYRIVIPIYKTSLERGEIISLKAVFKYFPAEKITFLMPKRFESIEGLIPKFKAGGYLFFDDSCFQNVQAYNKLLLSRYFYTTFYNYDYILIYQLDAYVFRDELDMWISKGYSYIGAPWFKDFDKSESSEMLWAVGNGGLSLRRVNDFLDVFNYKGKVFSFSFLWKKYRSYPFWKKCLRFPKVVIQYYFKNDTAHLYDLFGENEDHFWSFHASKLNPNFKIAPIEDALAFAFECNPQKMFELNHQQLPFGVHAWEKYNKKFWKGYILEKDLKF